MKDDPASYGRELGLDLFAELERRAAHANGPVRWLDLCWGSGRALFEAAEQFDHFGLADRVGSSVWTSSTTSPPSRRRRRPSASPLPQ